MNQVKSIKVYFDKLSNQGKNVEGSCHSELKRRILFVTPSESVEDGLVSRGNNVILNSNSLSEESLVTLNLSRIRKELKKRFSRHFVPQNDKLEVKNPFGFLLPANVLIVLSSIVSLIISYPENAWTGGNMMGFMGFTAHQNTLGALILFTSLPVVYAVKNVIASLGEVISEWRFFQLSKRRKSQNDNLFYFVLFTSNFLLLLSTYSRASIAAFVLLIFLLSFTVFNFKKLITVYCTLLTLFLSLYAFNPYINEQVNKLVLKKEGFFGGNRAHLWEASYKAAVEGGLTGLGYGISHPEIVLEYSGSHFDSNGRYIREKGNSILALIEEVGIVGLILFFVPVGFVVWEFLVRSWRCNKKFTVYSLQLTEKIISFVFILIVLLHSQFEAWMVGVTGFQLVISYGVLSYLVRSYEFETSEGVKSLK